jgi:hypothetical protein
MRLSKIKNIQNKQKRIKIDVDLFFLIRNHILNDSEDEIIKIFKHYNFESQDLDILNHLYILNKIKPKVLNNLKKKLKNNVK